MRALGIFAALLMVLLPAGPITANEGEHGDDAAARMDWTEGELETLGSLWIGSLPPLPADPSNSWADDPLAARLGEEIFNDTRFSSNGEVSCGTCHLSTYHFSDQLPQSKGVGLTDRRSMTLIGVAYNDWFFWDGRKDSLWSQALAPPESPVEHGISRTQCSHIIYRYYRRQYEGIFGPMPVIDEETCPPLARPDPSDKRAYSLWMSMTEVKRQEVTRIYVNMGKAIAAFVRRIMPAPSRFDRYVEAVRQGDQAGMAILTGDEAEGLRLFIGKAQCTNCHFGPLLGSGDFSNTRVPGGSEDRGRADGIDKVRADEFNCLSEWSDADPEKDCATLRFMDTDPAGYIGAFKVTTLRNIAGRPPYMHAGQLKSLSEVLRFYREAARSNPELGHGNLTDKELEQLEIFLGTLTGPVIIRR